MGYWKSKVVPKFKKLFPSKKATPAEATEETKVEEENSKAKEVVIEEGETTKTEEIVAKVEEVVAETIEPATEAAPAPEAEAAKA